MRYWFASNSKSIDDIGRGTLSLILVSVLKKLVMSLITESRSRQLDDFRLWLSSLWIKQNQYNELTLLSVTELTLRSPSDMLEAS